MVRAPETGGPAEAGPQPLRAVAPSTVLELLQPGAFVKLRNQPEDLPPFQLIRCRGGRCWVRQQAWGRLVHWEVAHRQLTAAA
jgi:hypothetical protein